MKRVSIFNKKQLLLAILLVSISTIAHAETYTSTATTGEASSQGWTPSNPVTKSTSAGVDTYTFAGGNNYTGNVKFIDSTTQNLSIVSDGAPISFSNWNIGNTNYLITGYELSIGNNITFDQIQGNVIRASGGSSGPGGSAKLTVGDNVTISNIYSNNASSNYGGGIYIFGPNTGIGTGIFGENFTVKNSVFEDAGKSAPFKGGGAIGVRRSMDLTFANNSWFEDNKVAVNAPSGAAQGGAITGVGNTEGVTAHNVFTFNGNATFIGNSAVSTGAGGFAQGGAIGLTRASGKLIKTGEVIFNAGAGTVNISNNIADATLQARGGAIFIGDGNLYIEAANIIIANNSTKAITGGSLGGALYTSTSDSSSESRGNITIVGNANITGNRAVSNTVDASYGGAIYANGNVNLRPNTITNKIVFRDNQAGEGAAIQLNLENRKLVLDYTNGGTIEFYDRFNIVDGSQLLQSGNGKTRIWSDSWGGNININSGALSIESTVALPNTIDGTIKTYGAGRLSGYNVNLGTSTTAMQLDIHDGASLYSGLTTAGYAMNISSGNTVNIYGSGALNFDSSISDGFNHFGSNRVISIGDNNTINLAARTAEQIVTNTYNTRGTDGTSKFSALHLASVGMGNTFTLNSNIAINKADKLVVTSTAAGTNYIKIGYDPTIFSGGNANETTKTLVVEAAAGSNATNLLGTFAGAATDIGVHRWTPTVKQDGNNWYIVGSGSKPEEPSTTVKTSKTMTHALMSTFRLINNDLLKRMGELRFNPNNAGVWIRTYTGESELKGGGEQRYTVIQGGVDKVRQEKDGKRFTGIALEHIRSANSFDSGSGTTKMYDIGVYQSWLADGGHYYDLVGKVYRTSNSMNIVDSNGIPAQGDYKGWAYGVSMEYGYRKELGKGYFAIPQIEFTYRHVGGINYKTSNNIDINQKAYDSLVGRAGVTIGRKYNNESQVYMTANIMREFIANTKLSATDSLGGSFREALSGKETWYNLAIGATIKNGKKNDWYMELERDFGSSCNNKWQILLGTRWSW